MKIAKKLSIFITAFMLVFGVQFATPKKVYALGDEWANILNFVKEFGIDTAVTILQNRILNKLVDKALNWANGGPDGDVGFLDNWDDFLEGTKHDVMANVYYSATKATNELANDFKVGGDAYKRCVDKHRKKAIDAQDKAYQECYDREGCELIDLNDPDETCANECDTETAPIFEETLTGFCGRQGAAFQDLSTAAANNYNAYMNGGLVTKRSIATSIANFGAKELNMDPVTDLINGQGSTLAYILGSQAAVDTFGKDITKGGWTAYIALSDPHNYPTGLSSLVTGALGSKTKKTVESSVQSMQTPQKYQDKRKCAEWSKNNTDKHGRKTNRVCLRYVTETPGSLVETKVKKALTKDEDQSYLARELSDVLARALGRLTDGLFQVGVSKLSSAMSGKDRHTALQEKINENFSSSYQNAYDVLGVADDARIFNENNANGGGNSGDNTVANILNNFQAEIGDDASVPYVGGPEDLENQDWNKGPELTVELKGNLEKSIRLTEQFISTKIAIKQKQNEVADSLPTLDHCLPGPDFNWEKRFGDESQDLINGVDTSDDYPSCNRLVNNLKNAFQGGAYRTSKQMSEDPMLNIPGSMTIKSTIQAVVGGKSSALMKSDSGVLVEKRQLLANLLYLKDQVKTNRYTKGAIDSIDPRIPLFNSDIYLESGVEKIYNKKRNEITNAEKKLSDQDLIELLSLKDDSPAYTSPNNIDTIAPVARCKEHTYFSPQFTNGIITVQVSDIDNGSSDDIAISTMTVDPHQFSTQDLGQHIVSLTVSDAAGNTDICHTTITIEDNVHTGGGNGHQQPITQLFKNFFHPQKAFARQLSGNATLASNYLVEKRGIYLFKDGETPETLVHNNRAKAEKILKDLGWDIWRHAVPATAGEDYKKYRKYKSHLRYKYYIIQNILTTEKDVLEEATRKKDIDSLSDRIHDMKDDCLVFKNKVISENPSNNQIKTYLNNEYQKQINEQNSDFKTKIFTSPGSINTSVLKFENRNKFLEYVNSLYEADTTDIGHEKGWWYAPDKIKDIFRDRLVRVESFTAPDGDTAHRLARPVLFCQMQERWKGIEYDIDDQDKCGDDYNNINGTYRFICGGNNGSWYKANKQDYLAIINGI